MYMILKLGKTYFDKGFFNLKIDISEKYLKENKGICSFSINKYVFRCEYKQANKNGQIRVFGKEKLKNFFKDNYKINDIIEIKFLNF